MSVRIILGDVLEQLKKLPAESVHCVVTSPPYWGLRDYGTAKWIGGDPKCDHRSDSMRKGRNENRPMLAGSSASNQPQLLRAAGVPCGKCGAVREDSQLGLEPTPELYIKAMVRVFRQVRRVLRANGTLWLNMGDCYASSGGAGWQGKHGERSSRTHTQRNLKAKSALPASRLKPKDLVGVPWMLAFALRRAGWWLRQDIIWAKPNAEPWRRVVDESFVPQPDVSEEKGVRGHEGQKPMDDSNGQQGTPRGMTARETRGWAPTCECHGVWNSIEVVEEPKAPKPGEEPEEPKKRMVHWYVPAEGAPEPVPATVLDPFGGAGTTGLVADRLQRNAILIELNPEYHALATRRIVGDAPMFVEVAA